MKTRIAIIKVAFSWVLLFLSLRLYADGTLKENMVSPSFSYMATNGVVFVGGHYIASPYKIEVYERSVRINDITVRSFLEVDLNSVSPTDTGVFSALLEIPSTITESSSCFDPNVQAYLKKIFTYFKFQQITNHADMITSEVKKLPCVVDAKRITREMIKIKWKNDSIDGGDGFLKYSVRPFNGGRKTTSAQERCKSFAIYCNNNLNAGGFIIIPGQGASFPMHSGVMSEEIFPLLISLVETETSAEIIVAKIYAHTGRELDVRFCSAVMKHKKELTPLDRERLRVLNKNK